SLLFLAALLVSMQPLFRRSSHLFPTNYESASGFHSGAAAATSNSASSLLATLKVPEACETAFGERDPKFVDTEVAPPADADCPAAAADADRSAGSSFWGPAAFPEPE